MLRRDVGARAHGVSEQGDVVQIMFAEEVQDVARHCAIGHRLLMRGGSLVAEILYAMSAGSLAGLATHQRIDRPM